MGKYSKSDLSFMARSVLAAEFDEDDVRPLHLYLRVSSVTGLDPSRVRQKVVELAGEESG